MKCFYLLLIGCLMSSCDFFQMENRISSDLILEEELHAINWQEVDTYPVFQECKESTDSNSLKCFTKVIQNKVIHGMRRFAQTNDLDSLTKLDILITIDASKNLKFSTNADSMVFNSIVNFDLFMKYIQEGLDSLIVVEPAFKRGIPVTTEFALPIVFTQEND